MRRKHLLIGLLIVLLGVGGYSAWRVLQPQPQSRAAPPQRVVINEAVRTLLYLPLYHAERRGYFNQEGVQVEIVTGGTATNSVAALIAGDADVAQADPMYAPISQESGSDIVVVGQVVGRIGLWAVERPNSNRTFDATGLRGNAIITHPQPMTAYTYTLLLLEQLGLGEGQVRIIQTKAGTELAAYRAERSADFLIGVEPAISILESQGARVVYSWPKEVGDRTFTGLMVRRTALSYRQQALTAVLRAYQSALDDIARSDPEVFETARVYFPNLEISVVRRALDRLANEQVFPRSLLITRTSWNSAIAARRRVGDLRGPGEYSQNVAAEFTANALDLGPNR